MVLNLKERAIIIYNLLWKYDSYKNLQLKESIKNKIYFTDKEIPEITFATDYNNMSYAEFSSNADLKTEKDYLFTDAEINYLAEKIMILNQNQRLNGDGLTLYDKIENAFSQLQEAKGFIRTEPWYYIKPENNLSHDKE